MLIDPFKNSFYAKFNYVSGPPTSSIEINPKWLKKWAKLPDGYKVKRMKPNDGVNFYTEIYSKAILSIHGGVIRSEKRWNEIIQNRKDWLIIVFNSDDIAEGIMYTKSNGYGDQIFGENNIGTIHILDMLFLTPEARHSLFHYIFNFSDQIVKVHLLDNPNEFDYYNWLEDCCLVRKKMNLITMARIIDVSKFLVDLPVENNGIIKIQVKDPLCEWNNHVFELKEKNGKLLVKKLEIIKSDIVITIEGLTSLLYGITPLKDIQYFKWIKGSNKEDLELLEKWFPPMIPCMFEGF